MSESQITIPTEKKLAALVYFVRGEKVFLDADLAMLYGVETGALNRSVKRNQKVNGASKTSIRNARRSQRFN